jgi:AraC-like DNA-binding protein
MIEVTRMMISKTSDCIFLMSVANKQSLTQISLTIGLTCIRVKALIFKQAFFTMKIKHSVIGIDKICRWAREDLGINLEQLFVNTGIELATIDDPNETIRPEAEIIFYKNLLKLYPNDALGVCAGYVLSASTYGLYGLALQSGCSVIESIRVGLKYIDFTFTYNHIYFDELSGAASFFVEPYEELGELSDFMIERDVAAIVRLVHDILMPINPIKEIFLTTNRIDKKSHYERVLKCPLFLGEKRNEIRFDPDTLLCRPNQANPLTMKLCCEQLDRMHPTRLVKPSYTDKVKYYLVRAIYRNIKLEDVAENLNISPRNLRTRLAAEGTNYTKILDDIRKNSAVTYLKEDLTLEKIAEKLGYSDAVSFSHAYKRWFSKAPRSS